MRTVIVLTRRCALRCDYCIVRKCDVDMASEVADRAVEFAFSKRGDDVEIQYFGGEPLLARGEFVRVTEAAVSLAAERGVGVSFSAPTNCVEVDEEFVDWAAGKNIVFELSLDGPSGHGAKQDVWDKASRGASLLLGRGLKCFGTVVFTPDTLSVLRENVASVFGLGVREVNVSPAMGVAWTADDARLFAEVLWGLHNDYFKGGGYSLVNMRNNTHEMLFNREMCVDCDGSVYAGNVFLYAPDEAQPDLLLGRAGDEGGASAMLNKIPPLSFYYENIFSPEITLGCLRMMKVLQSYAGYCLKSGDCT